MKRRGIDKGKSEKSDEKDIEGLSIESVVMQKDICELNEFE